MRLAPLAAALMLAVPAAAQTLGDVRAGDDVDPAFTQEDEGGVLNPPEMGMANVLMRAERGEASMTVCASGYYATKSGRHESARRLFQNCVDAGYTQAMTWMSYMEDNGLGGTENPEAAAAHDRRAAELGDPVGQFNHGLNMLRGRGTPRDLEAGREMVEAAAAQGLPVAQRLIDADWDLDEVTPDADDWKYKALY